MSIADMLLPFKPIAHEALLMPPSQFLVIGDELLVTGTLPTKFRKPSVVSLSKKSPSPTAVGEIAKAFEKANTLGSRTLAQFSLPIPKLKKIKTLASSLESTHIRFFFHEERGVVARLFDVRIGSDILLPRLKRIYAAATVDLTKKHCIPFSITISLDTLTRLPSDDLLLSVYADGILEAEPINSKFSHAFYCRDQGIMEPYISFQHETLHRTVYFVSHPSN